MRDSKVDRTCAQVEAKAYAWAAAYAMNPYVLNAGARVNVEVKMSVETVEAKAGKDSDLMTRTTPELRIMMLAMIMEVTMRIRVVEQAM
jgi:hypothetical protein